MELPTFEHGAWLARAWSGSPPEHNLAASGFQSPLIEGLLQEVEEGDVSFIDLNAGAALRTQIAARHGLDASHVQVTAGTTAANTAVLATLMTPGCNVVAETPTYTPLAALAKAFGAEVRWVERAATWDLDAVAAACDNKTAAILCTSPNNPTGAPLSIEDFQRLGDIAAANGAVVLCDQVYRELTPHALGAIHHDAIISTAGMNKCWGAAGLRVGWIVAAPHLIEKFQAAHALLALAPATFGMRMAGHLLEHEDACRVALEDHLAGAHEIYQSWCAKMGLDPTVQGLIAFPLMANSQQVAEQLLEQGIVTVPGELFGAPGHLRIGFGIPHDALKAGLAALSSALPAQRF